MTLILLAIVIAISGVVVLVRVKRSKNQSELDRHSISVEQLHDMMADQSVLLLDVRQPLDLLAYPEVIPGAKRIPPQDVHSNPTLIPRNEDMIVYCTCPSDKTSRMVLRRALALGVTRIKFLMGGLTAWKTKGYPVEPYRESFRLSTPTLWHSLQNNNSQHTP